MFIVDGIKYNEQTPSLAEKLQFPEYLIRAWSRKGKIPFVKVGGRYWYNLEEVMKALIVTSPMPPNGTNSAEALKASDLDLDDL